MRLCFGLGLLLAFRPFGTDARTPSRGFVLFFGCSGSAPRCRDSPGDVIPGPRCAFDPRNGPGALRRSSHSALRKARGPYRKGLSSFVTIGCVAKRKRASRGNHPSSKTPNAYSKGRFIPRFTRGLCLVRKTRRKNKEIRRNKAKDAVRQTDGNSTENRPRVAATG